MGLFRAVIFLGATLLVVAGHCEAGKKTETVEMTPEMKAQYEEFLQMQRETAGKQEGSKRAPAPEPVESGLPPEFNRPNSRVEKPGGPEDVSTQEPRESFKDTIPKMSNISKAVKSASHVTAKAAVNVAKSAAKGATSAYKNFKEAMPKDSPGEYSQTENHSSSQHKARAPVRQFNKIPPSYKQPAPQPPPPQPRAQQISPASQQQEPLQAQPKLSKEEEEKAKAKAMAKEARDSLFYRTKPLTKEEVLTYIDTLKNWPEYEQMKKLGRVPIDLDLLTRFSQVSEANCDDKKLIKRMEKMQNKLYYQEGDHGKALVPFLKGALDEQLKVCDFAQKSTDEFAEFANEDPKRWEMIQLWNHKVGHFGKRHTKWGEEDQYLNNGIQMNEALTEMIDEKQLQHPLDRYQYGYGLITALKAFCGHMDRLGGTLSMTRLAKGYKKNKSVKEFHKLMSVCEQTKSSNYQQALGGALGMPSLYSGQAIW